jgi:hypothetical protein
MKKILTTSFLMIFCLNSFSQAPSLPTIPADEVIFDYQDGYIVLLNNDTLKGKISYSDFGDRIVYFYTGKSADKKEKPRTFESKDSIICMDIIGKVHYVTINPTGNGSKLVREIQSNSIFTEYKFAQIGTGALGGAKIAGGGIQGSYKNYIKLNKKNVFYYEDDVVKVSKNIDLYLDECPELKEKVKNEEKGYKTTLIINNYKLLIKILLMAEDNCGATSKK